MLAVIDDTFRLIAAALLILVLALPATVEAQVHLRHETDTTRTVITLTEHFVEVCGWRNGKPMFVPGSVEYDGDTVRFPKGTEWEVEQDEEGMRITFPKGRTLKYLPSEQTARQACGLHDNEI